MPEQRILARLIAAVLLLTTASNAASVARVEAPTADSAALRQSCPPAANGAARVLRETLCRCDDRATVGLSRLANDELNQTEQLSVGRDMKHRWVADDVETIIDAGARQHDLTTRSDVELHSSVAL